MTAKKLEKESKYADMDANKDGIVSDAEIENWQQTEDCLLYTSDAADEP